MNTTNGDQGIRPPGREFKDWLRPLALARLSLAGMLAGLANLVPGISGGTMILVSGIYDDMVSSVAEVTRLHFTRRNILLVGLVAGISLVCIVLLAGAVHHLVATYKAPMYCLFIGLTLGGAPLLYGMMKPLDSKCIAAAIAGVILMVSVAVSKQQQPDQQELKTRLATGPYEIERRYGLDLFGGALGASAMVLPGISGAYMLLIINRYEAVLASIDATKRFVLSAGDDGSPDGLHVLIPVGIGTLIGLLTISNLLKWLLHRHPKVTLGFLLGILLGSVPGLWPFGQQTTSGTYGLSLIFGAAGYAITYMLSRLAEPQPQPSS